MRIKLSFLTSFFERNLFERLVIYLFFTQAICKLIFELILGQYNFAQAQNEQWVFFGLLLIDYLISFKKVLNIRVRFTVTSAFAVTLFIMIAHGLFIGVVSHNQPFVILNDAVPLLMIALNILRMQSNAENTRNIDYRFLLTASTLLALSTCIFGYIALQLGEPSLPALSPGDVFYPLLFAGLFTMKRFPTWVLLSALLMTALTLTDMNRTTMAFVGLIMVAYTLWSLLKAPTRGIMISVAVIVLVAVAVALTPPESKTYRRVADLGSLDLSSHKGSVGERQAEMDAISIKLRKLGQSSEWFGLGFGGVYEVARTHEYLENYGHAHYSWAWFYFRFGLVGYAYLGILVSVLTYNAYCGVLSREKVGLLVGFMCLFALMYCFTYVNAIFLLSGAHFLDRSRFGKCKRVGDHCNRYSKTEDMQATVIQVRN